MHQFIALESLNIVAATVIMSALHIDVALYRQLGCEIALSPKFELGKQFLLV